MVVGATAHRTSNEALESLGARYAQQKRLPLVSCQDRHVLRWTYSCKEGLCGTCETRVIAGEIDHRDSVLSPAEQQVGDVMMVCVSGCKGARLVLDL